MDSYDGWLPQNITSTGAISWADTLYAFHAKRKAGNKLLFRVADWSSTSALTPRAPFDCPTSVANSSTNERLRIDYTVNIHMTGNYGRAILTKSPSQRGVFMDGYRKSTVPDQGTSPAASGDYNALMLEENMQAWRHANCVNVAFFDGHVSATRYGTIPSNTGDPKIHPDRYFWGAGVTGRTP